MILKRHAQQEINMKQFTCYIKSHDEHPDYEKTVKAKTKAEAAIKIHRTLPIKDREDWDTVALLNFISEDNQE